MSKDGAAEPKPSWLSRFFARLRALFDPTPPLHVLNFTRTLPYTPLALYNLITDIPSYPKFVPYVTSARVTAWSPRADAHHDRRWPAVAALEVKFGPQRESVSANMVCRPPVDEWGEGVVEAFGGEAVPIVTPAHYDEYVPAAGQKGSPIRTVRAEWTVKAVGEQGTQSQVRLRVEYAFVSQVWESVGTGMAKKVADQVAEAFETRAKEVLGGTGKGG